MSPQPPAETREEKVGHKLQTVATIVNAAASGVRELEGRHRAMGAQLQAVEGAHAQMRAEFSDIQRMLRNLEKEVARTRQL